MIDETKIKEIVQKIAENVKPEKIILFGSYAKGNFDENSDLDLCVVVKKEKYHKNIYEEIAEIFVGTLIPFDLVIYTDEEIEEWQNVKMAFPTIITRTGKVLYEK